MSKNEIKEILCTCKTIAVVGLSREPEKDSYRVAKYMQKHSYRIVPVNPFVDEVLGERSYKSFLDIPAEVQKEIDLVDVFRRPEDMPPIVEQAVKLRKKHGKPCVVWMQLGIVNEEAAAAARNSYANGASSNDARVAMTTMTAVSISVTFQFTRVFLER